MDLANSGSISLALLAAACAIFSMFLYKKLSPQLKLAALKTQQQTSRQTLKEYDGNLRGLYTLIGQDLLLSLKQIALIFVPVMLATLPILYIIYRLQDTPRQETLFLTVLLVVSLYIKIRYKII